MFEKPVSFVLPKILAINLKQYVAYVGIGIGVLGVVACLSILFIDPVIPSVQAEDAAVCVSQDFKGHIVLYVSGAVLKPGVYKLPSGSRLAEAISAAGGVSDTADQVYLQREVNLAKELEDSEHLYIPFGSERGVATQMSTVAGIPTTIGAEASSNSVSTNRISINTATQSELESLPKIGTKTAEKILAGRPYTDLTQLVSLKILTQTTYDELQSKLTL